MIAPSSTLAVPSTGRRRDASASTQLRAATRAQHDAVEVGLSPDRLASVEDLTAMLRGWLTVWTDVQVAASRDSVCDVARDELWIPATQAVAWLRRDLLDLGGATSGLDSGAAPDCGDTERARPLVGLLADPASSWGVAYVLRGSRLGGTMIAPQVSAALGLSDGRGTEFFASAGTDPGREWVSFRRRLDGCTMSPEAFDSVAGAARWTFGWVGAVVAASLLPTGKVPA